MNEKFWDLQKSRQDSMINGSLKVFTRDGFRHASTDEIVAEASVSKGLLFHYFFSKVGLYEFLTEYCARFAAVELGSEFRKTDACPFFELQRRLTKCEARIMRLYPCLLLFLERVRRDDDTDLHEQVLANTAIYTDKLDELLENAAVPDHMTAADMRKVDRYLRLMRSDTARALIESGGFSAEKYEKAMAGEIGFFEGLYRH